MNEQDLKHKLISDLEEIRMPVEEVEICIRPYSKTYYGRYFPINKSKGRVKPRIFIYPYEDSTFLYPYSEILKTAIHEMCHHVQYSSGSYVRQRGIMHNPNFWSLYNRYVEKALEMNIVRKGIA